MQMYVDTKFLVLIKQFFSFSCFSFSQLLRQLVFTVDYEYKRVLAHADADGNVDAPAELLSGKKC